MKNKIFEAMNFCLTNLIKKFLQKTSFYYDKTTLREKNYKDPRGREIIVILNQLDSWVLKQINF